MVCVGIHIAEWLGKGTTSMTLMKVSFSPPEFSKEKGSCFLEKKAKKRTINNSNKGLLTFKAAVKDVVKNNVTRSTPANKCNLITRKY